MRLSAAAGAHNQFCSWLEASDDFGEEPAVPPQRGRQRPSLRSAGAMRRRCDAGYRECGGLRACVDQVHRFPRMAEAPSADGC